MDALRSTSPSPSSSSKRTVRDLFPEAGEAHTTVHEAGGEHSKGNRPQRRSVRRAHVREVAGGEGPSFVVAVPTTSCCSATGSTQQIAEGNSGDEHHGESPHIHQTRRRHSQERGAGDDHVSGLTGLEGKGADGVARPYNQLLDDHSAHFIIIRKGVTLDDTPEFESYRRTNLPMWRTLIAMLLQLEAICVQYAVPLATVDGKRLAALCEKTREGHVPPVEQLLACIHNIQEVAAVLRIPGRRFQGPHGGTAAATTIQAHLRGCFVRSVRSQAYVYCLACCSVACCPLTNLHAFLCTAMWWRGMQAAMRNRQHLDAARSIQHGWRLHRLRRDVLLRMHQARATRNKAFEQLQQRLKHTWASINCSHRVVIHIPSLSLTPTQRASVCSVSSIPLLESAQISRVCDVADPLVDVVYVTHAPMDTVVEQYWTKLLEAGGVTDPGARFRVLHPENGPRLPERLPLTAKLLASPRAMERLKLIVHGRPAFIVPGIVGDSEIDLAVALGLPLLASHPAIALAVATKSGARAVFKRARMNVAPGRTIVPVAMPPSQSLHQPSAGPNDASMVLDFKMVEGELLMEQAYEVCKIKNKADRKDRPLSENLAKVIVEHPMVMVRSLSTPHCFG
jgi:hypothetical protein